MEPSREAIDKIIDAYALKFLDDFEQEFNRLPNETELMGWRVGFADGCYAIGTALLMGADLTDDEWP